MQSISTNKFLAFSLPGSSDKPEQLVAPSSIPEPLQGGLSTAGGGIIQTGINILFLFVVVLALIMIMYSGIEWISSGGDMAKIGAAKKRMTIAVIAVVLAALAFFIVRVILTVFGGDATQFLSPSGLLQ